MEEFTEEDLPLSTSRKRKSSYQAKKKICSNCCQSCYGPRKKSQNPNSNTSLNYNYNCIEDDDELYEMLAALYKLNYISSSDQDPGQSNNFIINKSSLTLCSSCTRLLYKLYPLFSQFNQLRQLDSQLARGIKAVDKILMSHKFYNNDNNSNLNINRRGELKHDGFSPADGPWIKIGRRLEEMEFKEIGYRPHRKARKIEEAEQDWPIFDDPIDISDGDHGNDNFNDDEIEKCVDVKLFSEPVSEIDGNLLLPNENESSLPKNKLKSKSKSKPKKLNKEIKSKVETDYDDELQEEQEEDNDDDYEPYSPKPKSRGRPRNPRGMEEAKTKRKGEKKERAKKYQNRTPRPVKTDSRNERRRQRYHRNRDLLISGYKPPPEQEEDLKCVVVGCGLEFKKASDLKAHERQSHVKDGPYLCNLPLNYGAGPPCTSTFPILFLLKRHQQTSKHVVPDESLKVTCEECGKVLQNKLVYNIHFYRRHTEQGRKVYDEDQKRVADKQKKQRAEERQLLLQKGFFCDICQVDFQTKIKLTNHKISAHEDYGKRYKPYVCEICGKKCVGLYRLNQHVTIVHSEERPVICALCGRRYKTEGHLRGHMKTGHDEEGRRKYNQYMRESNRRRKELAEALARKALEDQQGESQEQEQQKQPAPVSLPLPLQLLPTTSSSEHSHHHQQQISIGESLLLNLTNPMMDFTFTTTVQNP